MTWKTCATGCFCHACGAQIPIQTLLGIPYTELCWPCLWHRRRHRNTP